MKNYFKGLLSGIAIAVIIALSCVVFAEDIQVAFNTIRISINGIDKVHWGESYMLDNGNTVPYSIVYNGTTYLPLRKIGELYGKTIYWNGDSQTAYTTEKVEPYYQKVAEKPDKNGNVWTYSIFTTGSSDNYKCYLIVKDAQRGYERVYHIAGSGMQSLPMDAVYLKHFAYITDQSIIFAKIPNENTTPDNQRDAYLWKIDFLNDVNTQDGEALSGYINTEGSIGHTIFLGDYLFYTDGHILHAYNMITGDSTYYETGARISGIIELKIHNIFSLSTPIDGKPIVFTYSYLGSSLTSQSGGVTFYHDGEMRFEE